MTLLQPDVIILGKIHNIHFKVSTKFVIYKLVLCQTQATVINFFNELDQHSMPGFEVVQITLHVEYLLP